MGWFFTITEEMRQWGLSGNELLVFALVNTYSQGENGCYWGGIEHTCECCGISKSTAIRTFNALIGRGLIKKNKVVVGDKVMNVFIASQVSKCDLEFQNDTLGGVKMTPRYIKDIYKNNTLSNARARFQKPSLSDVREYCIARNNEVDPEQFFNFYESKGWIVGKTPMKDWKAAVRTWEKREKEVAPRKREKRQESVFEHNLRVADQLFGTNLHEQAYGKRNGGRIDEQ